MAKAKVGMRTYVVVCGDEDKPFNGTIIKVEPLIMEETGEILSEHFPTTKLDDGRIVNGMAWWWHPIAE